jgi:uncharacterized protein YxjI
MKLYVSEKLLSLRRKFYVTDDKEKEVYQISSKILSIGDKTYIKDMKEKELAYIEQNLFHLTSNYDVYVKGKVICNIRKKFQLFRNDYVLDSGHKVEGEVWMFNFAIYDKNNTKIGSIKRKFFSIGDKYEITIYDEKQTILVLSIVVTIANDINRYQRNNDNF